MTLTSAIVSFSFVFENQDFSSFTLFFNFSRNFCTFNERFAYYQSVFFGYSDNFVERYNFAFSSFQFFYENGEISVGEVAGRFFGLGQGIVPVINGINLNELLINML